MVIVIAAAPSASILFVLPPAPDAPALPCGAAIPFNDGIPLVVAAGNDGGPLASNNGAPHDVLLCAGDSGIVPDDGNAGHGEGPMFADDVAAAAFTAATAAATAACDDDGTDEDDDGAANDDTSDEDDAASKGAPVAIRGDG